MLSQKLKIQNKKFKIYSPLYINMATLSADVTTKMVDWADKKVKQGLYKSRSELVRELFREKMICDDPDYLLSQKALEEVWKDEDDKYWESLL